MRRWGVQARSTLVAVLVVAAALVLLSLGVYVVLDRTLAADVQSSTMERAEQTAALAGDDLDAASAAVRQETGTDTLLQVVDSAGQVLVSSPDADGRAPLLVPAGQVASRVSIDGQPYVVASVPVESRSGRLTILAAQSLEPVERTLRTVLIALGAIGPLLLIAVGVATWLAVGNSLSSVRSIRTRVEDISVADLSERVPVPPAKDEIRRLALTMNHMLADLDHAMSSQRQFVADASHELRSPVAALQTTLEVAQRTGAGLSPADLDSVTDDVHRLGQLVSDLLLLARMADTPGGLREVDVDLDDVVRAQAARLRDASDLQVQVRADPARVLGDPGQLTRAVANLAENAARFARQQVLLTVTTAGDRAVVRVEDDGPGIPEDRRQEVFDRFVRLDEHRARDDGGAGLGLAIVREIVQRHGGEVELHDSDLGGAQVVMRFPLASSV